MSRHAGYTHPQSMANEARFTGHFRRPNESGPGFEFTLVVGETATRISLGDDVLGTWPNSVIDLRARSPLTLQIDGETWLVSMPEPAAFLIVAEARFSRTGAAPRDNGPKTPTTQTGSSILAATAAEPSPHAPPAPNPAAGPVEGSARTELDQSVVSRPPSFFSVDPRTLWSRWAIPHSAQTWGGVAVAVVLLVAALALEGLSATIAAVAAGAVGVLAASAARRERDAPRNVPRASLTTADVEAQFARALGSAIGKSHQAGASREDIDDLMSVRGIGRQYAQVLIDTGVGSLEQLANLTSTQRAKVERALGAQGERLGRERWVEQAAEIVEQRRKNSERRIR